MHGAQALCKALTDAGLDTCFANPGTSDSMMHLNNPSLDWVKIAEGQGVPATRATTAEEFHQQFEAAMSTKGPRLIEAQIVQNLKPVIDAVHKSRG
jgi:thiamine pyrophosphate-dependent acetolactate synthase large subunit-like protein